MDIAQLTFQQRDTREVFGQMLKLLAREFVLAYEAVAMISDRVAALFDSRVQAARRAYKAFCAEYSTLTWGAAA